jgi:dTDP-4-dehydrorhamnose 3,5-epimerase
MPITLESTPIDGLIEYCSQSHNDSRGSFSRLFCVDELQEAFGDRRVVQINRSVTHKVGAIRGLHFQFAPHAEMKVVRCLRGRAFDVAVDLRANSPTRLCWHGVVLSPEANNALVIPEGFAHGFQVLQESTELLYLHSGRYVPSAEGGIRYSDASIGIDWPLPVAELSDRDRTLPLAHDVFQDPRNVLPQL